MMLSNVLAFIGNLGTGEMILIVLVILLLFGAKRIPDLARGLGKGIREFKDATNEIKSDIEKSANNNDRYNNNQGHNNQGGYNNGPYNPNPNAGYNQQPGMNNPAPGAYNNDPAVNPNPNNTTNPNV
ncbi:twin-arginine translocase TatA/TatE family subunit [Nibribacter ruber]|uniref:Sec-independent protein translocase protein TatA n=1 Tax=Nibribacter ruber TaxID=2698458 RepID=A0A6P1P087_9BACT|nr:twin-arginine translocase TatA/TatE family subunit [Nibribacter ruber]